MTTSYDIVDTIWKRLDLSSLKSAITGKIRKNERPAGSDKEDIVVNSLPSVNRQLQISIANVNIFVPDLTVSENGVQEKVADFARLKYLTSQAIGILNDVKDGIYYYEVQQDSGVIEDKESNSHFTNLRINFYAINLN